MTTINFECRHCGGLFDADVGDVAVNEQTLRRAFEKPVRCPQCGPRSLDQFLLTELGQTQMSEATWHDF